MSDNFQYIKLPDGSYGKFSASADDSDISAQIQKDFPSTAVANRPGVPNPGDKFVQPMKQGASAIWSAATQPIVPLQGKVQELNRQATAPPGLNESPLHAGARTFMSGVGRDVLSQINPLNMATAGLGGLGVAGGAATTAARVGGGLAGVGFGAAGAKDIAQGGVDAASNGITPDNLQQMLGGGAQLAGGAAAIGGAFKGPTVEQVQDAHQNVAETLQRHLQEVADKSKQDAVGKIQNVNAKVAEAFPDGAIDPEKALNQVTPEIEKYLAPGESTPKAISNLQKPVNGAGSDATGAMKDLGYRSFKEMSQKLGPQVMGELGLQDLPEGAKWSMEEARAAVGTLERAAMKAPSRPIRAALTTAAESIRRQQYTVADEAGALRDHLAANRAYADHIATFEDPKSPVAKSINGTTPSEVIGPITNSDSASSVRRMLRPYAPKTGKPGTGQIDLAGIKQAGDFHSKALSAEGGSHLALARLANTPAIMLGGALIGHPGMGMFGAAGAASRVFTSMRDKMGISSAAERMKIGGQDVGPTGRESIDEMLQRIQEKYPELQR